MTRGAFHMLETESSWPLFRRANYDCIHELATRYFMSTRPRYLDIARRLTCLDYALQ